MSTPNTEQCIETSSRTVEEEEHNFENILSMNDLCVAKGIEKYDVCPHAMQPHLAGDIFAQRVTPHPGWS